MNTPPPPSSGGSQSRNTPPGAVPGTVRAGNGVRDPYAHTRAVRTARVALPVVAGLVLLMIVIWPLFGGSGDNSKAGPDQGDLEMTKARYLGTDTTDRPFEIRASRVMQLGDTGSKVDLTEPEADITMKGGDWLSLAAEGGHYDQDKNVLTLQGKVSIFHGNGYEFRTSEAALDVDQGIAWGNKPVEGQGPLGMVEAGGFRVLRDGDVLVFTGAARLRAMAASGDKNKPEGTAP
jgi:lipopolysaccharide export system protein LptC